MTEACGIPDSLTSGAVGRRRYLPRPGPGGTPARRGAPGEAGRPEPCLIPTTPRAAISIVRNTPAARSTAVPPALCRSPTVDSVTVDSVTVDSVTVVGGRPPFPFMTLRN